MQLATYSYRYYRQLVYINTCLPTYLASYLPTYLATYLPTDLPTHVPRHRPTDLTACLPACLPVYTYLPSYPASQPASQPSIHPSIHPSSYLSMHAGRCLCRHMRIYMLCPFCCPDWSSASIRCSCCFHCQDIDPEPRHLSEAVHLGLRFGRLEK